MNDLLPTVETPSWVEDLPEIFHRHYLGVERWQWLGLIRLSGFGRLVVFVTNRFAGRLLRLRNKYLPGEIEEDTLKAIRRSFGLLCGTVICYPLVGPLNLPPKLERGVLLILEALTILGFSMIVYGFWDAVCDSMIHRAAEVSDRAERLLLPMTRKFVRLVIVIVGLFVAMSTLFNVNVAAVIASLGIGGIVVALAAKDSVENIFGSVTILFDMPFKMGDHVRIDKVEGIVEEINLRSTRIRTFEDTVINLPNANLIRAAVENVSARRSRRQQIKVRVPYDADVDAVNALCSDIRAFLADLDGIFHENTIVDLSESDDIGMTVLVQCHFEVSTQAEELEMRHKLFNQIMRLRKQHAVPFYPIGIGRVPEPSKPTDKDSRKL